MVGIVKTPDFFTHVYNISHEVKTYSVYEINKSKSSTTNLLTDTLRIEIYYIHE